MVSDWICHYQIEVSKSSEPITDGLKLWLHSSLFFILKFNQILPLEIIISMDDVFFEKIRSND
jgi:hypothetical protein